MAVKKTLYDLLHAKSVDVELTYPTAGSTLNFAMGTTLQTHRTNITNARETSSPPTLNKEGFCLLAEDIVLHDVRRYCLA